jgi:hypothetical protein
MSATAQFHEGIYAALSLVAFGGLLIALFNWPRPRK